MSLPIEPLGENGLLLRLGTGIDIDTNARVHALAAILADARPAWLQEIVPAFDTLALFVDLASMQHGDAPLDEASSWVRRQWANHSPSSAGSSTVARTVELPVHFGGEGGPDLEAVAAATALSRDEVVARFCAPNYQVAMLGFAPGFPYLIGLDPTLAVPRLETPRTRVPAGSVAIGGAQAGVYPLEGPGGWRLLGRTQRELFDPRADPPTLLVPGDRVRFVPAR